jgi:transposase
MPRRRYTREFKLSAVKLVNEQGYSIPEAARSLGVDAANVRAWVEKFPASDDGAGGRVIPLGEGALKAELRRLRKENARLLMEREILKKAAAFFAQEQP